MRKVFLIIFGLLLTGVCFGQVSVNNEKPFSEKVMEYYRDCNLDESTILKLFEDQIYNDYEIDFEFKKGQLMSIINEVLVLPPSFQKSIIKVIENPDNWDDNEGNFIKR